MPGIDVLGAIPSPSGEMTMSPESNLPDPSLSLPTTDRQPTDSLARQSPGPISPTDLTAALLPETPTSKSDGAKTEPLTRPDDGSHHGMTTQALTTQPEGTSGDWDRLPAPVFEVGRIVFDKYRLLEQIGEGGMGEVWKVHNVELDRTSALKLIKPEIAQNDKGWTRFQREARLMAKLNHPNAVAVYDFKRTRSMGYIEMEFVRGRSLDQILKDHAAKPMTLEVIVQIVDQLCSVLKDAHSHEDETTGKAKPIIHRDLKPSNLMLVERKQNESREIQLKVLDFGIAKMVEDDGNPELTGAHDIIGTPSYMSPEQIKGGIERDGEEQGIDGRSDLYSTGVMLYQLLSGSLPFHGNKMAVMAAHLHNKPLPMKEINPQADVNHAVERVVLQCLEKDPDKRPQTARELADRFRQAAGITAGPGAVVSAPTFPWPKVAAAVAGLGVAAGALFAVAGMFKKPPASADVASTNSGTSITSKASVPSATAGTADANALELSPRKLWIPEGFAAPATAGVDNASGLSNQLKREDGALFALYRDGMYLPAGYAPEDSETPAAAWPKVIVRKSDKTKFIWIDSGTYRRGDPRPDQSPATDRPGNPLTPHHVRLGGFYVQETEVTNGEIQHYLDSHPNEEKSLRTWRDAYESFRAANQIDDAKMKQYPAVCVGYAVAVRYAASVGGRLPTEAQWEFAAKSRHDDNLFAWGKEFPRSGERPANLEPSQAAAAPVKTFPTDKTEQGVYDMTGNVHEFCADAYQPYDELKLAGNSADHPLVDHREKLILDSSDSGQIKIAVRGGSYMDSPRKALAFMRDRLAVDDEVSGDVGFRVVIECPSRTEQPGSPAL
jgi:eukaryotic-like serine/threonine-protein kinase